MGDFRKLRVLGLLPGVFRVLAGLSLMVALGVADAALTDVSDAPFYNSTSSQLKPNIMLLMDTSNSMRFSHMPDQIEGTNSGLMPIGYKSYQCNVLYYNPNRVYEIPKDSSGSSLPTPSFTAAPYNYFSTDASLVNLSSSFQAYDTSTRQYLTVSDPAQAAYYYLHSVAGTKNYLDTPCTDADVGATVPAGDGGTWTRVLVSSTSGPGGVDERQNFANWYTFYRTRISLIKSAVSLAFMPLTDSSRVGFITVNPDLSGSANYLPIADFNATQRSNWYSKLFSQVPGGSSPSREGLARVGRHFAGKQDSINSGMSGDPIQFSCQQNFTIMTTDGYWNVAAETAGPVKVDGVTQVGQQDGTLDTVVDNTHWTQRPMWDGGADTLRVITDKTTQYRSVACVSPYANRTTSQNLQSTSQNLQSTTQNLQSTSQNLQSTLQNLKSTSQLTKSTSQITQSTLQNLQSTSQKLKSTSQLTRSTTQLTQSTLQNLQSTVQKFKSTSQLTRSTSQLTQSTSQITQSTLQNLRSTSQITRSTSQVTQSTSQITQSTLQNLRSTSQLTQSTSQITVSTLKAYQSTSQILQYDATTELTTPVASCTPGGNISCTTVTTGPTLVASCTPVAAAAGNLYTATTCSSSTTGPTPAASCTPASASAGNGYTTTTCNTVTSGPTPVASCTPAAAGAGNSYTTTTCNTVTTGPTPVATCTPASASSGNSYTATTCSTATTGPTGVASCTPVTASSGNSYTATTCNTVTTGPTGVASCTPVSASAGNSYTATTCNTVTTGPTGVASCTPAAASSGNSYTATTCNTVTTGPTAVASCTPASASSGNSYTTTTCSTATTGPTPVASCTPVSASSGNSYTATTCNTVTTGPTGVSSCTPVAASSGNSYTATTCNTVTTGPTGVSSCTPASASSGNSYTTTTCNTVTTGPTAVASCTAATASSSNSYTTTTCNNVTTGPTPVATCTPVSASAGNSYTATTCSTATTGPIGVATCTPVAASAGNGYTATTCNTVTTGPTGVASCTPATASASNSYTTTTCNTVTTGPTAVASCTAATASSSNSYTTTTCSTVATGPTPVASCTPVTASSGNSYTATTCATATSGPTGVSSCTPVAASSGNSYTATTCNTVTSGPTGVSSCTPATASSSNGYTTTTCNTVTTGPSPVAACTPSAASSGNSYTATTCSTVATGPTPVATCTPSAASSGNSYTATTCSTANTGPTPVATCTPISPTAGNGYTTTTCTTATTGPTAVATCTPATASAGNSYTATTCTTATSGPTPVASCTSAPASADNSWVTTTCSLVETGPTEVASCTPISPIAPDYETTTCDYLTGHKLQKRIQTGVTSIFLNGGISGFEISRSTSTDDPDYVDVDGVCHPDASTLAAPLDPVPDSARASSDDAPPPSPCSEWPCVVDSTITGGSSNSLADVAQYYYVTDLRPELTNDVRVAATIGAESDRATHQHMTTFTLALGVSGTLKYSPTYKIDTVGDFARIRCNPLSGGCNNTCPATDPSFPYCTPKSWPVWPDPTLDYSDATRYSDPRSIDDFWHTAVNGRGLYFSADDPNSVVSGLQQALAGIQSRLGAGSAAATSTLSPVAGDNAAYRTSYVSQEWVGDLAAYEINPATGVMSTTTEWRSQPLMDATIGSACDRRTIYLFRSGASNNLTPFTWDTRACDVAGLPTGDPTTGLVAAEQAYFGAASVAQFSQYPSMSDGSGGTVDQRTAAAGANLVNYLRGQHTHEGTALFTTNDLTKLYRARTHVLGDFVNSQPAFVKGPFASYADSGYATFKSDHAGRTPMIYAGANDGMLHAFVASNGAESWAFIPRLVLPNLFKLADNNYANTHQFYVDGSPTVGDIYASSTWKTILVGGLNKGGKGYYALDVTDPAVPKALWEFGWSDACWDGVTTGVGSDCHLGYTFGRPIISKLQNGTWVVFVTSGVNNVNSPAKAGDGNGYLYVLNADTGKLIAKIATGVGDAETPSGLNQINNFVDNVLLNNTSLQVYGVDLLGNVWRFDINDNLDPDGLEATLLGTAKDSAGNPQPITTRPELAEIEGKPWVFIGTGRLLGLGDLPDTSTQSTYGFKDPLTGSPVYADLRSVLNPLQMTQPAGELYRTIACSGSEADCAGTNGWVVDLPESGERVNIDPKLQLGTLTFASNVPSNSACSIGGHSWLNFLDFRTGLAVPTSPNLAASRRLNETLAVGLNFVRLTDGRIVVDVIGSGDKPPEVVELPVLTPPPAGKRVSWREVIN